MAVSPSGQLPPGRLVVANELWDGNGGRRHLPLAPLIARGLDDAGLEADVGPVAATFRPDSAAPATAGAGAVVDAMAALLVGRLPRNPVALVHAVASDERLAAAPTAEALALLSAARGVLERWARICGPHEAVLASPRSFCAGVERAIDTVRRALDRYGAPVYVRRQIVHNLHVVRDLEQAGAVFVEELDEVPEGSIVVFAAHGVSPAVRAEAAERADLRVIDATCPLVAKVHSEARRYAAQGHQLVLIGHPDHEEVEGTLGEAPGRFHLVERAGDVGRLRLDADRPVAYLTQTTLATDETAGIVDELRQRFPAIVAPPADDICYATQNRQDAVRSIAGRCDLMLVVGSANSSNTARLVEVARREGCRAELVEDTSQLQLAWLEGGVHTVGLTAGASAPDSLVEGVLETLGLLGPLVVSERPTEETVRFALPTQVR